MKVKVRRQPTHGKLFLIIAVAVAGFMLLLGSLFAGPGTWQALEYRAVAVPSVPIFRVAHLPTPQPVKALYLTSWVAGAPGRRDELVSLIARTELNSVVIDIKDYTGRISFAVADSEIGDSGAVEERIPDIKAFIAALHDQGIYVIGRISVFQDSFLTARRPDLAVHRRSDGAVWRDRKGIAWLEVGATEVWAYTVRLARAAYAVGFDELNFDYIRFPSDGDLTDIVYRFLAPAETRAQTLARFFVYLKNGLADIDAPLSADLFGLTTTALDDLGIGQMLVAAAPYFDYLAPMLYPSHFAPGFLNFANPAAHPYEVVSHSLNEASRRLLAASSTPAKLRPWLQDFDLGADYTAELVRAQIQATYDAGLNSWMLWDPANRYTPAALDKN